ncbi:FAD-binding oxidoreductase [Rhodovibrio salinarum]|uniref:FAD-binding oxidoreductase n=1 Tax=Rhodovibrio salinarum TaxID=1087 RepID=A0A934QG04_9PROT|nr:FAD-binding oxidoreductase [Rhodovibrio salinarum]MBK1696301.1 FAD-binding oxidoreductase [Rhodovibrio salinarum]
MAPSSTCPELLSQLGDLLGPRHVVTERDEIAPRLIDWRRKYTGNALALVKPGTTAEVAAVVRACADCRTPIVPQGGHTSLVGGSTPDLDGRAVILSTERLTRVRDVDPVNNTMTVEAGCILQSLQEEAARHDRLFPLSLAAEGTCRIGGNLATNAGGLNVLRYGNARDQVLGLEVVLPDGQVWDGLRTLRKDNTGYDLKQLFVGSEGTLGIITAATLKLQPQPLEAATAFCAVRDVDAALDLLARCQQATAQSLTSFELIPRIGIDLSLKHVAGSVDPLEGAYDWYVLVEAQGGHGDGGLKAALEGALMQAYEDGLVLDAAPAESAAQAQTFWHLREAVVEAQRHEGGSIKHDIAVPVSSVPAFLTEATAKVHEMVPGIRPVPFGHLGDGNLHFNLTQPEGADTQAFLARWDEVNAAVHDIVARYRGSISAEHGIGQMKVAENARFKPPVELEMMRAIKRSLDPGNIMNPGKVIDLD